MGQSSQQLRSAWANHIQQHHESGLTGKAYCEQNNLNYDQFGYWKKRIKDQFSSRFVFGIECMNDTLPFPNLHCMGLL